MSRRSSRERRRLALVSLLLAAFLASAAPAAAISVSVPANIIFSYCTTQMNWRGEVPNDNAYYAGDYQALGTVRYCTWWYKLGEQDSTADYFLWSSTASWTNTQLAYLAPGDNYGSIKLTSSIAASGNIYSFDPDHDIVLNQSCVDIPISVGAGAYYTVGITITPRLCNGGKLNLDSGSSSMGSWSSPDITRTPRWEVSYLVKVGQGKKPGLSMSYKFPCYNKYRDSATLYWKYTKVLCTGGITYQTR